MKTSASRVAMLLTSAARASLLLGAALALTARAAAASPDAASVVRVSVTHQIYDTVLPWQSTAPRSRSGFGVWIDSGRVLTTEHLVRNSTLVEISRFQSAEKIPCTVLRADPELNLALLAVSSPSVASAPAVLFPHPPTNTPLTVLQFDELQDLQTVDATLMQRRVVPLPDTPYGLLCFNLLCDLNVQGEGAPVFAGGRVTGLIIAFQSGSRIATMLSWPFLERFMARAESKDYRGVAVAGFSWSPLVDPVKRRYLGVPAQAGGILVQNTVPGTRASSLLQPEDVIVAWNGQAIDSMGFYADPDLGRVDFSHLIKGVSAPEMPVLLKVVRAAREIDVALTLESNMEQFLLVPENVTSERAPYFVVGGFVLRELDGSFLRSLGGEWASRVAPRLARRYLVGNRIPHEPGERVVFVSEILPDPINIGYQQFKQGIVTAVNGHPVRRLDDVFAAERRDGPIRRLTFEAIGVDVVLDASQIAEANARLASQYKIPAMRYAGPK